MSIDWQTVENKRQWQSYKDAYNKHYREFRCNPSELDPDSTFVPEFPAILIRDSSWSQRYGESETVLTIINASDIEDFMRMARLKSIKQRIEDIAIDKESNKLSS